MISEYMAVFALKFGPDILVAMLFKIYIQFRNYLCSSCGDIAVSILRFLVRKQGARPTRVRDPTVEYVS
jgi:hypothetical protein